MLDNQLSITTQNNFQPSTNTTNRYCSVACVAAVDCTTSRFNYPESATDILFRQHLGGRKSYLSAAVNTIAALIDLVGDGVSISRRPKPNDSAI